MILWTVIFLYTEKTAQQPNSHSIFDISSYFDAQQIKTSFSEFSASSKSAQSGFLILYFLYIMGFLASLKVSLFPWQISRRAPNFNTETYSQDSLCYIHKFVSLSFRPYYIAKKHVTRYVPQIISMFYFEIFLCFVEQNCPQILAQTQKFLKLQNIESIVSYPSSPLFSTFFFCFFH